MYMCPDRHCVQGNGKLPPNSFVSLCQGVSRFHSKVTMPAKEPDTDPLVGTKYEKIKFINSGSFGYVVLARNKETSAEVAIKFVEVSTEKDVKHRCGSALHPRCTLVALDVCTQIRGHRTHSHTLTDPPA